MSTLAVITKQEPFEQILESAHKTKLESKISWEDLRGLSWIIYEEVN